MDSNQPPPAPNQYPPPINGTNNNMNSSSNPLIIPPNFDFNSLPPAEREILIRRLQLQQQQLQRNRQVQEQNFQRMTLNAYSTPRPPLSQGPPQAAVNPTPQMYMNPMAQFPFHPQMMSRPVIPYQQGINPSLLQSSSGTSMNNTAYMSQINPQQFMNPLSSGPQLKADPVLFSANTTSNNNNTNFVRPPMQKSPSFEESHGISLPPLNEQILSSEGNFIEHLIKFLDVIKFTNRTIPQIGNRPISLFRLFQVVNSAGGFLTVGETKKWPLVTQALQLPAQNFEVVSTVRATYFTFLYAYEQYFVQRKPLDKIDLPNQPKTPLPYNQQQQPAAAPAPQKIPQPPAIHVPSAAPLQNLKFIPDSDLNLWKPFADLMKIPISPAEDIESVILCLNCPYNSLKTEALLATQRLFAQTSPKDLQSAGFSSDSLKSLIEALEKLWIESVLHVPRIEKNISKRKTMETLWAEVDERKRSILSDDLDVFILQRITTCRQIVSVLRTLAVVRGAEICQILCEASFIKNTLLPFCLMECDDWEIYKDSLILAEALSTFLVVDEGILQWSVEQCRAELNQVRRERLSSFVFKLAGSLDISRLDSFENLIQARQTVSGLITQCAQLWKLVPSHIFLHLSLVLNFLTSSTTSTGPLSFDLGSLSREIEAFFSLFVMPTVALLRSVRGLFECTKAASSGNNWEEVRRILETVIYSPNFSLTDGGFLELSLQILSKCHGQDDDSLNDLNWTGQLVLLRELRDFWRHSSCEGISALGKACYNVNVNAFNSPAKQRPSLNNKQNNTLAILKTSTSISSVFSHPYMLLCRSLELFSAAFPQVPDGIKLDLLDLAVEWNLQVPSKWGHEVLGSDRIEESLNVLRENFMNKE